uniref:mitogen-activated protein kinase kinase n=1 Tax=Aplanochytrium stocchinoi TaxID=215587 RepID=A0A7S3PNW7_9STRA
MLGLYYEKLMPFIRFLKVLGGGDYTYTCDTDVNSEATETGIKHEPELEPGSLNNCNIGNLFNNLKQNKTKQRLLVNQVYDQQQQQNRYKNGHKHKYGKKILIKYNGTGTGNRYNGNEKESCDENCMHMNVVDLSQKRTNPPVQLPAPLSMSLINEIDIVNLSTKRVTAPVPSLGPCPSPLSVLNEVVLEQFCLCTELELPNNVCSPNDPDSNSELYQYIHVDELGRGSFGTVSLVRHRRTNKQFALKTIDLKRLLRENASEVTSPKEHADFLNDLVLGLRREIRLLQKFRSCPYITKLYHTFVCDETKLVYLCFEDVCDTPLEYFVEHKCSLTFEQLQAVAISMLCALRELHDFGVVHLDVKPGNILINKAGQVKLCDFGAAVEISHAPERVRYTKIYTSPEYFFQGVDPVSSTLQRYEESINIETKDKTNFWESPTLKKSDVWSLGITLLELSIATSPFRDLFEEVDVEEAQRNLNRLYCEYRKIALGLSTQLTTDSLLLSLLKEPHFVCRKVATDRKETSPSSSSSSSPSAAAKQKDDGKFEIWNIISAKLFSEAALDNAEITYSFIDFVERCLRFDEDRRSSVEELCSCHYFVEVFENPHFRIDSNAVEGKVDYDIPLHFAAIRELLQWKNKNK